MVSGVTMMRTASKADQTRRAITQKSLSKRSRLGEDVDASARRVVDANKILEKETSLPAKVANQHSKEEPYETKHDEDL